MLHKGQFTILLVDPDAKVLDHHAALLQEMGLFNHLQAENGPEALSMINNFYPELVIACQDTPVINGLTLLRQVRQEEKIGEEIAFVLYGDNIGARLLAQAGRSGVNALVMTPCPDEEFQKKISGALTPPENEADEKAEELYEQSVKLLEAGQLDQALEACRNILKIHASAEVYFNIGYIKSMKGQFEEALFCFHRATIINRRHARAYKQMGLIYQKLGQLKEARQYLKRAASIHMARHQDDEAEEVFNIVLTLRPDTTNVYNSLGILYRRQGRFAESRRAYEKALKVHPDDEHVYFNAARTYLELKETKAAQEALRQAMKLNPGFATAGKLLRVTERRLNIKISD